MVDSLECIYPFRPVMSAGVGEELQLAIDYHQFSGGRNRFTGEEAGVMKDSRLMVVRRIQVTLLVHDENCSSLPSPCRMAPSRIE